MKKEMALGLYINGYTLENISDILNLSRWIITENIKRYIPLRNHSESAKLMKNNAGWFRKGHQAWNKGRSWSESSRKKMSISQLNTYKNNPTLKKTISRSTKESMKNVPYKKLAYWKGKNLSQKHKDNIGKAQRGSNHWNWHGGTSFEPYPPSFNNHLKNNIKRRDDYTCQFPNCDEKHNLVIHHIDYNKKNNKEKNLVTLCNPHNMVVNANRIFWKSFFQQGGRKIACAS